MKRLLMVFVCIIFLSSFASALELNPFADKKIFDKYDKKDLSLFIQEGFNEKYGSIRISKTFFWFESDKIAEYTLTSNTDECFTFCEANGRAKLHEEGYLFENVKFLDKKEGIRQIDTTLYIRRPVAKSTTITKYDALNKSFKEDVFWVETKWEVYDYEKLPVGEYEWRLTGNKHPKISLDWVSSLGDIEFTEWAWWEALDGTFEIFNTTGTQYWTVPADLTNLTLLVVGGGGAGGTSGDTMGGGAGGGVYYNNNYTVTPGANITIVVGAGGIKAIGANSSFESIITWGGGSGGNTGGSGVQGGSGGGAGNGGSAGAGLQPASDSNGAGSAGGNDGGNYAGGGGGGASAVGQDAPSNTQAGDGGAGKTLFGQCWAGGGGGGSHDGFLGSATCGGGDGGQTGTEGEVAAQDGTNYTGGGGGSCRAASTCGGGNGVVIVRYVGLSTNFDFNLTDPTNGLLTNNPDVFVQVNITPSTNVNSTNVTIKAGNHTNFRAINTDLTFLANFTDTYADGTYTWNVTACGENTVTLDTFCEDSLTESFSVDSTNPTIVINNNETSRTSLSSPDQVTVNATSTDTNLDSCWFYTGTNLTNVTYTCNTTFNTNFSTGGRQYIMVYANDTYGNVRLNNYTFVYRMFFEYENYETSITEGSQVNFSLGLITDGTPLSSAILNISSTPYTGNAVAVGNNYTISRELTAPGVVTDTNLSFYWNVSLTDGFFTAFPVRNITVLNFEVDNCSTQNNTLYNFTMVSEAAQVELVGATVNTTAQADMQIWDRDRDTILVNYSTEWNAINPFTICLSSDLGNSEIFNVDLKVQYDADGYAPEFYHIQNERLTEDDMNTNITLYDLLDASAQEFQITYRDANFRPVAGALIQIQRNYISEGVFKTVELPITATDGTTLAHLVLSDVEYSFIVIKDGVILATFENQLAVCDNVATGDCTINLNEITSSTSPESFANTGALSFTLNYEETTRAVEAAFVVVSGSPATNVLNVTLFDGRGTTQVCDNTLITSSGTLSCIVPAAYENSTIVAEVYTDGDLAGRGYFIQDDDPKGRWGGNQIFIGVFAILLLIGIAVSDSAVVVGILSILGFIILAGMNIISKQNAFGAVGTGLWFVVAVIIVVMKAFKRE